MIDYSTYSDNELVAILRQNDVEAFNQIYDRYFSKLFDSGYKRLHNTVLCEEVVQDVFIKLWERRDSITLTIGLSNYLYTAIKYKVFDLYREQLLRNKFTYAVHPDKDNSTIELVFLNDLKAHIEVLVEGLPDKCRSVYRLSRVEHKTNKEIALLLNISEKTVEGHLTKALAKLKIELQASATLIAAMSWWLK